MTNKNPSAYDIQVLKQRANDARCPVTYISQITASTTRIVFADGHVATSVTDAYKHLSNVIVRHTF